jgi:hypothetical protein
MRLTRLVVGSNKKRRATMAKKPKIIKEHDYHVVVKVTVTYTHDCYNIAANKAEAEETAVTDLQEHYSEEGAEVQGMDIKRTKIRARHVSEREAE